jgi:hypothetical protein
MSAVCVFLFLVFAFAAIIYFSSRIGPMRTDSPIPPTHEEVRSFRSPAPEDLRRAEQEEACLGVLREEEARAAARAEEEEEFDDVVVGGAAVALLEEMIEEEDEEDDDSSDDDDSPW